jgi:crossover junction endonuclease MUS81
MNQNTHYGSYQVTRKASSSKTTTQKQMKAKNPANQAALDKLAEVRQKRQEKNPNSNYIITIKRAMNSLRACNTPITSQKEACQLKNIGPAFAKIICPHQLFSPTATDPPPPFVKAGTKRQRQSMLTSSPDTTAARTKIEQGPTNKQNVYEKEKSIAESLDLKTCGPWRVILLVDNREHKSQHVVSKCKQSGIPCEERTLPIGDMTWIAQCTKTGKEILCGTIMERKESSDLVSSLFGTRYLEQRLRMQHCGLPQLLYLVEGNIASNGNCPAETLQMAMMETRVLGFNVIQTAHLQGTVKQLKGLHRRIVQRTFPEAFSSELPTFAASPTESIGNRRRRRPTSLLEMKFDTSPKPPLSQERFMTYHELKAKVEMDREAGTRTIGAVYMAMRELFACDKN